MNTKKNDVLANLAYASASMAFASEIPGYNGSLFAISDDIKERIESDITEASAAIAELIAAAKGFDRFYSDIWNREDGSLLVAPGNAEKLEEAFNRMQAALARIGGAP